MSVLVLSSSDAGTRAGYVIAVVGACAAVGLRLAVAPYFEDQNVLLFFVPVVLAAATVGGQGPAILAAALCLLLGALLLDGPEARDPGYWIDLGVFVVLSLLIAMAASRLRRDARETEAHRLHLESILKTIPDAMIVIDETGTIRSFSAAATRIFGWSQEEAIGANVTLLMSHGDAAEHGHYMGHYLMTGEKRIIDSARVVTGIRKDGSRVPLDLCVGETHAGSERLFTGFMRDLSGDYAEGERIRSLQEAIAHDNRVTAMGQMASMLAHEINQPLTAIANYVQGASELLVDPDPEIERARQALEAANKESIRAGLIVRNLRDFITKGQGIRQPVVLAPVIEDALALALVGEHDIKVTRKIAADLPPVYANPIQIQQVVVNLTRNAIQAMSRAGTLELRVTSRDRPGDVVVTIADRGVGLSKSKAENLFAPFESESGAGMGLGLSICQAIVESHGGQITGRNRKGGGAAFTFTLPHDDGVHHEP